MSIATDELMDIERMSSGSAIFPVLGMNIHAVSYQSATDLIVSWAQKGKSRYVCLANVHMVMEGYDNRDFQDLVNKADLVTPDGMPLVWMLKRQGVGDQTRVSGPALTIEVMRKAAENGIEVGFFGAGPDVLKALVDNVQGMFPDIRIAYAYSPPYRNLTEEEDERIVSDLNDSGARILFVGLGCPKQERWMANHKNRIKSVMLGVGAAFDFHAGFVRLAPQWIQNAGLEWAFRLLMEPRRLWKRYAKHNPRFVFLSIMQVFGLK